MAKYYLDTSIWLDLFEKRNEPNLPKGDYAEAFILYIIAKDEMLVYSNAILKELEHQGYAWWETERYFKPFAKILLYAEFNEKQFNMAKDISAKRCVPVMDALHAIMARDNKAIMISRDRDFIKLKDIVRTEKPEGISGI